MGFALWIAGDVAWAQGLHEYRPMGVAVVAVTDRFRQRDFHPGCPALDRRGKDYLGLFASLGEVNAYLRSQAKRKKSPRRPSATPAWI